MTQMYREPPPPPPGIFVVFTYGDKHYKLLSTLYKAH